MRAPLCVVVLLLVPLAVFADEVRLKNGDRLTGDLQRLAGGKLSLKTAYGGELALDWAEVAEVRSDKVFVITVTGRDPVTGNLADVALADIAAFAPPDPPLVVTGGANAGVLVASGNTRVNNLHLDGDVVARARRNRYRAGATINRAEDRGLESARNASASFNYDRFWSERLYANGNAIFTNDRFRGLDLRSAFGAGVGYQAIETAVTRVAVEAGLGYVNENLESAPDESYVAAREAVRAERRFLAGRFAAFHEHDGYFGVTGDDNLFIRMQNGVRAALGAGMAATVQLGLDFDNSPPPGRRKTDRTFVITLGYRF
jgi:putative salt-induced outer membrane protein YdiY